MLRGGRRPRRPTRRPRAPRRPTSRRARAPRWPRATRRWTRLTRTSPPRARRPRRRAPTPTRRARRPTGGKGGHSARRGKPPTRRPPGKPNSSAPWTWRTPLPRKLSVGAVRSTTRRPPRPRAPTARNPRCAPSGATASQPMTPPATPCARLPTGRRWRAARPTRRAARRPTRCRAQKRPTRRRLRPSSGLRMRCMP